MTYFKKTALSAIVATAAAASVAGGMAETASAAEWTNTNVQYQYGNLRNPYAKTSEGTNIFTFENTTGFNWGDTYFFVDLYDNGAKDNYADKDAYSEGYAYFSSAKILGQKYTGLIKDIGAFGAYNYAADVNYLAYYAGAYVDFNVTGVPFLRAYVAYTFDDSDFNEKNGWHADIMWSKPFEIGNQRFLFTGHMEWMQREVNDFGPTKDWYLTQPQLRWDVGYALTGKKDVFQIGTEYQFWYNKLGTDDTESAFQALAVYNF